jgi:hypothetical protein
MTISGTVEVVPGSRHLDIWFVDVPRATDLAFAFGAKLVGCVRIQQGSVKVRFEVRKWPISACGGVAICLASTSTATLYYGSA